MELKISCELILLVLCAFGSVAHGDDFVTEGAIRTITQTIPVVQSLEKFFRKPTLEELRACDKNRESCLVNCPDSKCLAKCPSCPIIVEGPTPEYYERGVNDTDIHKQQSDVPPNDLGNLTTVVKVENVIENTFDTNTVNLNMTKVNDIAVHLNESTTGGLYNLGYNRNGSCCLAVRPKTCHMSWEGKRCHRKRQRTCGVHCTSRVIYARVGCNGSCVRYSSRPKPRASCRRARSWPFVACNSAYKQKCNSCYRHYGYNSRRMPRTCRSCFTGMIGYESYRRTNNYGFNPYGPPPFPSGYPFMYAPPAYPSMYPDYGDDDDLDYDEDRSTTDEKDNAHDGAYAYFDPSEWKVKERKCKIENDDGTTSIVDCSDDEVGKDTAPPSQYPFNPDEEDNTGDDYIDEENVY